MNHTKRSLEEDVMQSFKVLCHVVLLGAGLAMFSKIADMILADVVLASMVEKVGFATIGMAISALFVSDHSRTQLMRTSALVVASVGILPAAGYTVVQTTLGGLASIEPVYYDPLIRGFIGGLVYLLYYAILLYNARPVRAQIHVPPVSVS